MPVPTVADVDGMTPNGALTDEIVREGAGRMLAAALEGGVSIYLAQLAAPRDEAGRGFVGGHGLPRRRERPPPGRTRARGREIRARSTCRTGHGGGRMNTIDPDLALAHRLADAADAIALRHFAAGDTAWRAKSDGS